MSAFQASPGSPGAWRNLTLVLGFVMATVAACATSEIPQQPLPFSSLRPLEASDFLLFEGGVKSDPLREERFQFEGVLEAAAYAPIDPIYSAQGTAFQLRFREEAERSGPLRRKARRFVTLALVIPRSYLPTLKLGTKVSLTYIHRTQPAPALPQIGVRLAHADGTTLFLADVGGAFGSESLPGGVTITQGKIPAHVTSFLTPSGCRVRVQHFPGLLEVAAGQDAVQVAPGEQETVSTGEGGYRISILESFQVQGGLNCLEQPERGFAYLLERVSD